MHDLSPGRIGISSIGFSRGRKTREPREKPSEQVEFNHHILHWAEFALLPHSWEATEYSHNCVIPIPFDWRWEVLRDMKKTTVHSWITFCLFFQEHLELLTCIVLTTKFQQVVGGYWLLLEWGELMPCAMIITEKIQLLVLTHYFSTHNQTLFTIQVRFTEGRTGGLRHENKQVR